MKSNASLWAVLAIATGTLLGAASGCELIAGIDRDKINAGGGGSGGSGGGGSPPTTTAGGSGGGCDVANCPDPAGECKVAACDANAQCVEENAPDGTAAEMQMAGDCK